MAATKHKETIQLIKSLSGQANVLTIPRVFIEMVGEINAALLLSQCIYWSDKGDDKHGWFYKSYKEWNEEIGLTQYRVGRAAKKLETMDLIKTKKKKAMGAPTIHYKVDFTTLTNSIMKKLDNRETSQSENEESQQSDYQETEQSLTKTTHETTHENTDNPQADMVGVLSQVTGMDYKVKRLAGRLAKRAKELREAEYAPAFIEQHYGSGGWWYQNDWRGQKGNAPTPEQIVETVGQVGMNNGRISGKGPQASYQAINEWLEDEDREQ